MFGCRKISLIPHNYSLSILGISIVFVSRFKGLVRLNIVSVHGLKAKYSLDCQERLTRRARIWKAKQSSEFFGGNFSEVFVPFTFQLNYFLEGKHGLF